jgi:hypothetical protein
MMSAFQIILMVVILATAFPAGYLLAYLCRDELKNGRKWFRAVGLICVVLVWGLIFLWNNIAVIGTLAYIGIVACISLIKSSDKKWTR